MTTRQKWINPLKDRNVRANLEATRILAERGLLPELPATVDEEGDTVPATNLRQNNDDRESS
jgi:hypothetical protein